MTTLARINVDGAPFHYRPESQGDRGVIQQIFGQRDYDLDAHGAQSARLRRWERSRTEPLAIIDAGANIGASAVWFRTQVPCSRVIAIEPEQGNYALLYRNVEHLTGVTPILGAVAAADGVGVVTDPGKSDWGFRVRPLHALEQADSKTAVSTYSMSTLLDQHPALRGTVAYVLKVDIEGGEEELFGPGCDAWLTRFALIIIELHDWLLPGRGVSRRFVQALADAGCFDVTLRGENLWCWSNNILGAAT